VSNLAVKCRRGDSCAFVFNFAERWPTEIPADYTTARFEVREIADDTTTALIAIDENSGVTINHGDSTVSVLIGATVTEALPVVSLVKQVHAQLRLYSSIDPDDRLSWVVPRFLLLPDGVDDE